MFHTKLHSIKSQQPFSDDGIYLNMNKNKKKSGLKAKQNLANENIIYALKNDLYPSSPASCKNVIYNNIVVTSQ